MSEIDTFCDIGMITSIEIIEIVMELHVATNRNHLGFRLGGILMDTEFMKLMLLMNPASLY